MFFSNHKWTGLVAAVTCAIWNCDPVAAGQQGSDEPVKVYILAGQSNMVGIGQVAGGTQHLGSEIMDAVLPVYPGKYDPDYDKIDRIDALREEFGVPEATFVVGTVGFHGENMGQRFLPIDKAQLAVDGETGNHPRFKGNVKSVDTRPFWKPASESPKDQDYHYNQNGETYYLVGEAYGKAMVEILEGLK